jgi:hypothetical protein
MRREVKCDEASVRELFTKVLGREAGYVILNTVKHGDAIVVQMEDGSVVEMANQRQALEALAKHFAWRPTWIEAFTLRWAR